MWLRRRWSCRARERPSEHGDGHRDHEIAIIGPEDDSHTTFCGLNLYGGIRLRHGAKADHPFTGLVDAGPLAEPPRGSLLLLSSLGRSEGAATAIRNRVGQSIVS